MAESSNFLISPRAFLLSFVAISLLLQACATTVSSNVLSLKINLIHRDSPLSPFRQPNTSISDHWSSLLYRSAYRHDFHLAALAINASSTASSLVRQPIGRFDFGEYLMKFSLGTPPVEFLGVVDLNGDFVSTWCFGCSVGHGGAIPSFDPGKSSTYRHVPCGSNTCANQDEHGCAGWDRCEYTRTAPDRRSTTGILVLDTLRVAAYGGGQTEFQGFGFGCCTNHCPFHNKVSAWVGVAGGLFSLVQQLSYSINWRFSHCLTSDAIGNSHLQFGKEAILSGFPARMDYCSTGKYTGYISARIVDVLVDGRYYLSGPGAFNGLEPCNVVFDTLSPLTYLVRGGFDHLVQYLPHDVNLPVVRWPGWDLCFRGTERDLNHLPEIGISFRGAGIKNGPDGTLDIHFPVANTYGLVGWSTICLLIKPTDGKKNIIGTRLMHNVGVGYDLINNTIYMDRLACDGL
ncbi:hypothetical protein HPP92_023532 [Vanilla planifolia]|uniref:Peptidase A1 domain-containing protein n=1 Tax=Vanilla planifolia TaxID=51239 RepID=A0A835PQJ0_VANPL|nr:hypothetical protein HPP92_023532 [Vanilla planifolia]